MNSFLLINLGARFHRSHRRWRTRLGAVLASLVAGSNVISPMSAAGGSVPADKTLVAWVQISDLASRGGSVLTIGSGSQFDALDYGEKFPRCWIAGSENFKRSSLQNQKQEVATDPTGLVQVALVQKGNLAALYRNGLQLDAWTMSERPPVFGANAYVLFGLRHPGAPEPASFEGSIADARIYAQALSAEELIRLVPNKVTGDAHPPLAWWNFADGCADKMGTYTFCNGTAEVQHGRLILHQGTFALFDDSCPPTNRVVYRPGLGNFGDPIPYFYGGRYHVFYLQGGIGRLPWSHIVSDDLVHWTQLPPALVSDGKADSWDGGQMATGSVVKDGDRFYAFYTGQNFEHPTRREVLRLAESDDLIHWTKHPEFLLRPDGKIYSDEKTSDFRDAFVFKSPGEKDWRMILAATKAGGGRVTGQYTSSNLLNWTAAAPLKAAFQECPDLFKVAGRFYLLGGDFYTTSTDLNAGFEKPSQSEIDHPGVYAGKSLFDGRRHVWVGWIADRLDNKDDGKRGWGGTMCTPRELIAGPDGNLFVKVVDEVVGAYTEPLFSLGTIQNEFGPPSWSSKSGGVVNTAVPASSFFDLPNDCLVQAEMTCSNEALLTFSFRAQDHSSRRAYAFTIDTASSMVTTHGQGIEWKRMNCSVDTTKPIKVLAILTDGTVEFFLNDQYAFSRRAHELPRGQMGVEVERGEMTLRQLSVKGLPAP